MIRGYMQHKGHRRQIICFFFLAYILALNALLVHQVRCRGGACQGSRAGKATGACSGNGSGFL